MCKAFHVRTKLSACIVKKKAFQFSDKVFGLAVTQTHIQKGVLNKNVNC